MKDIVTSFRFLDDESTSSLKSENLGPSFKCATVKPGSIEEMICVTPELVQDDREMANVFQALLSVVPKDQTAKYQKRQQKWLEVRNRSSRLAIYLHYMYRVRIARLKGWFYKATHEVEAKTIKTYRNKEFGFEYRLPEDMHVETLEMPHHIGVNINITYQPYLSGIAKPPYSQDPPIVDGHISVKNYIPDEKCIGAIYSTAAKNSQTNKINAPKLNGFYVGDDLVAIGVERKMAYQYFDVLHHGTCYQVSREMWFVPGPDEDEEAQDITLDSRTHYDAIKEMVASFRFLDN
jgi:hypothetical protein